MFRARLGTESPSGIRLPSRTRARRCLLCGMALVAAAVALLIPLASPFPRVLICLSTWITIKMVMVLYQPRKESARKPPSKQRRKDVPMKSVTMLADVELGRCIIPMSPERTKFPLIWVDNVSWSYNCKGIKNSTSRDFVNI